MAASFSLVPETSSSPSIILPNPTWSSSSITSSAVSTTAPPVTTMVSVSAATTTLVSVQISSINHMPTSDTAAASTQTLAKATSLADTTNLVSSPTVTPYWTNDSQSKLRRTKVALACVSFALGVGLLVLLSLVARAWRLHKAKAKRTRQAKAIRPIIAQPEEQTDDIEMRDLAVRPSGMPHHSGVSAMSSCHEVERASATSLTDADTSHEHANDNAPERTHDALWGRST